MTTFLQGVSNILKMDPQKLPSSTIEDPHAVYDIIAKGDERDDSDMESDSVSSLDAEIVPITFYGNYEPMPESEDNEDASFALNYEQLAEQEGIKHMMRTVPLGSYMQPFSISAGFVEGILVLRPLDPTRIVDMDTLVIASDLRVIGKVLEVFGPVEAPLYSVLCHEEFLNNVPNDAQLFYLPDQAKIVQTAELKAQKCTDADENEVGEEFYSDDEAEAAAKRERKPKRKAQDIEPGEIEE